MDSLSSKGLWEVVGFKEVEGPRGVRPDLLDLGCPTFAFDVLPEQLEALACDGGLRTRWGLDEATVTQVQAALPAVRRAHDRVLSLDLPLLAAPGDAQPMNALWGEERVRWFDLSEASVAHPFLDLSWMLAWTSGHRPSFLPVLVRHPDLVDALWSAYLQALNLKDVNLS